MWESLLSNLRVTWIDNRAGYDSSPKIKNFFESFNGVVKNIYYYYVFYIFWG